MVQKETQGEREKTRIAVNFAETAKKQFEELSDVQSELFERFQEANKRWLNRIQAEASLSSEFVSKLSSAHSIPDAMNVYQEWGARRLEMMAEDVKRVMDDTQKLMQAGTHMLTNGFGSKGLGISS